MTKQHKALELAEELCGIRGGLPTREAASDLIRAQRALIVQMQEALQAMLDVHGVTQAYTDKHIQIPQSWVEVSDVARSALAAADKYLGEQG